jgi:hypothetical protein
MIQAVRFGNAVDLLRRTEINREHGGRDLNTQ